MKYLKLYYRSNTHTYYRSALAEEHFLLIWMIWSTNSESQLKCCCLVLSCAGIFCDSMDCAPLSKGFPRQEYWSELPFSSLGDLPNPGIEPASPALAGELFTTESPGKPCLHLTAIYVLKKRKEGIPWWSRGYDSALPLSRVWVLSGN